MCVALEREQAVAGYINTHPDSHEFTIEDVNEYIMSHRAAPGDRRWDFPSGGTRWSRTSPRRSPRGAHR